MTGAPGVVEKLGKLCAPLLLRYPTLHLDGPTLRGTLPVEFENRELDRFAVEIDLTPVVEGNLPKVREVGGRIPWLLDRHVDSHGVACVCLPQDFLLRHTGHFDLSLFVEGPVRDFFIGQALVERGVAWPHGEWAHGEQAYKDWLDEFIRDATGEQLAAYLRTLSKYEMKGHLPCPCGSGQRIRNCHLQFLMLLRKMITPKGARDIIAGITQRVAESQASASSLLARGVAHGLPTRRRK